MKKQVLVGLASLLLMFSITAPAFASTNTIDTVQSPDTSSEGTSNVITPNRIVFPSPVKVSALIGLLQTVYDFVKTIYADVANHFFSTHDTVGTSDQCKSIKTNANRFNPFDHNNWVGPGYTTSGMIVRTLQEDLADIGINPGAIDGYYGPNTKNAIEEFQRDRGLSVDGIAGYQTWTEFVEDACHE